MIGPESFRSIAMHERSASRFFNVALAQRLRRDHDATIHLYCSSSEKVPFYESLNRDGLFASISVAPLMDRALDLVEDPGPILAAAREYEQRLGHTMNEIVLANRHFGRGYALGGFYHPRSTHSEKTTYEQVLNAYVQTLRFWEDEFDRNGTTMVLNGDKVSACASRLRGIPFRAMAGSRFRNYHYWAVNEHYDNPRFAEAFERADGHSGLELEVPYHAHVASRRRFHGSRSLSDTLRAMKRVLSRHVRARVRGRASATRGYYLRENLSYLWRIRQEEKRLAKLATTRLTDLDGRQFVYFPLHIEPEAALQIISPEYFYQLSAIAALSRDLPAGVMLAVKEAFGAIGRRPRDFYRQILEFKNVVLLDTMEMGLDCVRRSSAVATICGTAGLEGAVSAKPVIAFGRHNIYNVVPHVKVVTDESRLEHELRWALEGPHDLDVMRRNGRRMLEAIVAESFDMRDFDYVTVREFDREAVTDAHASLVRSLKAASVSSL